MSSDVWVLVIELAALKLLEPEAAVRVQVTFGLALLEGETLAVGVAVAEDVAVPPNTLAERRAVQVGHVVAQASACGACGGPGRGAAAAGQAGAHSECG